MSIIELLGWTLSILGLIKFAFILLPADIQEAIKKIAMQKLKSLFSNSRKERCLSISFGKEETNTKTKKVKRFFFKIDKSNR